MSIKIYLSPSNQIANRYSIGGTNEKVEMEEVAKRIKTILDAEYVCETFIAMPCLSISRSDRPMDAKNKGCSVYLAIHSNAGSGANASGAEAFYHPKSELGKLLATKIVEELGAICPVKSTRKTPLLSGMVPFFGKGFAEIREPHSLGMVAVLAETNFHDNSDMAEWIINNKTKIAQSYVNAIIKTFGISEKKTSYLALSGTTTRYYRVQLGAYSKKENAEAIQKKLRAAGFNAIIKYE